ncbi:helix-turn-helix domain-containing protein [Streptomyces sp. NPDC059382]|uniref:helix-turn-helix domain-containing protein n=1 Tax=Streptomyces sp. NPDC059382 TaxID=3346816 RepID=UPI003682AD66
MIPHGRPAITEAELAAAQGRDIKTWRLREAPTFRARVSVLNPGERLRLYDRAQADAYAEGRPLPVLPTEPHPADLLGDQEVADVLGISRHTVRAYATTGYLPPAWSCTGAAGGPAATSTPATRPATSEAPRAKPPCATWPPNSPHPTTRSPARPNSPPATRSAPAPPAAASTPHANSATTKRARPDTPPAS